MPLPVPADLERAVAAGYPRFLEELQQLVNVDCGSYTPLGVNRVADFVATALAELGAGIERTAHRPETGAAALGDLVVGRIDGAGPRLLLIGHMDTVFPAGTAAARPFRTDGDHALGTGVIDMKGGLLAGLHAIAALQAAGARPYLTFVANPDEEIGTPFSTPHIKALTSTHDVALVLECARANGDIVSA